MITAACIFGILGTVVMLAWMLLMLMDDDDRDL